MSRVDVLHKWQPAAKYGTHQQLWKLHKESMYDTDADCGAKLSTMLKAASSETFVSSFGALVGKSPFASTKRTADPHNDDLCHYCRERGHMHHNPDKSIVTCLTRKAKLEKKDKADATGMWILCRLSPIGLVRSKGIS